MKKILTACIALVLAMPLFSQKIIRNYSFEYLDALGKPISWAPQNSDGKYAFSLDTLVTRTGKLSVLIKRKPDTGPEKTIGLCNTLITRPLLAGKKKITITAYIKTENVTEGVASIWMQLNGNGRIVADKNSDAHGVSGTKDWTQHTIELPLSEEVASIGFGCKMSGKGNAWFDDFEVRVDGVLLE